MNNNIDTEKIRENVDSCRYCGACRVVRPTGEWQFNCKCDDPTKRPVQQSIRQAPAGKVEEFVKEARNYVHGSPSMSGASCKGYAQRLLEACTHLTVQAKREKELDAKLDKSRALVSQWVDNHAKVHVKNIKLQAKIKQLEREKKG